MSDGPLSGSFDLLRQIGFFEIIMPAILVYTIVFGILQRTRLFGKVDSKGVTVGQGNKEIDAIIALAISLIFVGVGNLTGIIQKFIPYVGLLSVLIVCFLMIASFAVKDVDTALKDKKIKGFVLITSGIAFLWSFAFIAGWITITPTDLVNNYDIISQNELVGTIIFLAVLGGIVFWITKSAGSSKPESSG